ncbi:hypothetical protein CVT26_015942 [Gymnopilus dilepis]|uniref:Pyridoxamine 5'-phosphate oxidase Alr4036 family FMN-binding domain-containing protein n=1 Tax=Gymnopilus dilepis TaxID=231916 RepID=A0A409XYK2_9AGAR|nr:hypothetical protein CVT26_015942 [Gymnopilus dilepis]
MTSAAAASPRWKIIIDKALSQYKNANVFQVATIDNQSPHGTVPRARSQVFRHFLTAPNTPTHPLLISSTDSRTPKVTQLTANPKSEIVWWIEGTQQQFRLLADVYLVPSPNQKELHGEFLRKLQGAGEETGVYHFKLEGESEWEARRVELFRSMSPHMKASWCRPTPGSPLKGGPDEAKQWPTRVDEPDEETMSKEEYEEAKKNWEMALGNFMLFVVDPVEVDFVDLAVKPNRRFLFKKRKEGEGWVWDEEEVVP